MLTKRHTTRTRPVACSHFASGARCSRPSGRRRAGARPWPPRPRGVTRAHLGGADIGLKAGLGSRALGLQDRFTRPSQRRSGRYRSHISPAPFWAMSDRAIRFTIEPEGPFSLQDATLFGFGQRAESTFDGVMRLAFCLDGYRTQVGVEVRQDEGSVHCRASDSSDVESVRRQVARVLSLDVDANDFMRIGEADRVIGRLQRAAPGVTSAAVLLPVRGGSGV